MWRGDQAARNLEALMLVADRESILLISGNGEVIEPDENYIAIGKLNQICGLNENDDQNLFLALWPDYVRPYWNCCKFDGS